MTTVDSQKAKRDLIKVTVSKDGMSASVFLRKPTAEEEDITAEAILSELKKAEVQYGIDRDTIEQLAKKGTYHTLVKVAAGTPAKRGEDAKFDYNFDTTESRKPQVDDDGRIDYHNINFIQSIEAGAALARKTPPTAGEPGTDVRGRTIPGKPGRDTPFNNGANTKVSDDGLELIATSSGAILFTRGKISVNNVLTITGDVDFNVGNIDCRGSVRVTGGIKAGFELKLDGDLEVIGNVEDASIEAKGNIMVKGGFFGSGQGHMYADGDVMLKYVEAQTVSSGGTIIVGGEIVNCQITAKDKVLVRGRHGKIIGGDVRAGKEIRASEIGTDTGTRTNVYVAYDVELMARYRDTLKEIARLEADDKRISEALYSLYRQQVDGKLSPEKEAALQKLEAFRKDIPAGLESLDKRRQELEAAMAKYKDARIIAEQVLRSGARAHFGIVYRDIFEDVRRCKLTLEGSQILLSDFHGA
jgi:uncharacterized protein (DUF342 family)